MTNLLAIVRDLSLSIKVKGFKGSLHSFVRKVDEQGVRLFLRN